VVCPGLNDGRVLRKTVRDLLALRPATLSIGVVPLGLTRFRRIPLAPVDSRAALRLCRTVESLAGAERNVDGERIAFCADELFIKAGLPIPGRSYYAGYPQYENGIGVCRSTLEEWRTVRRSLVRTGRRQYRGGCPLVVTSVSGQGVLADVVRGMIRAGADPRTRVVAVTNSFFGESVTVAGLLTARDIVNAVRSIGVQPGDCLLLPSVMFNTRGHTLDGCSAERIGRLARARVRVVRGAQELAAALGLAVRKGGS
jgi:NifB/MoaA-like Fe-S oxidoreductase